MRLLALTLVVLALAAPARAHQSSVKYTDVSIEGARAHVKLTVAPSDVTEPLGLAADARPTLADALARAPQVAAFVESWLAITLPAGPRCAASAASAHPDADAMFVIVRWDVTCPEPIATLRLDFSRFFALDARHEAILAVHAPGAETQTLVVRAPTPTVVVGQGTSASVLAWIGYGMDHIYGGLDHIFFVLALLLVVVLARGPEGWQTRRPLAALRSTAVIVTAFTVAHSISLIAASLGWISLPGKLVESIIAASIVYTAIENVIRPDVRWRFGLTFAFGLIHGLGFASMLEALLPPGDIVMPLLTFNLGVELGQLTVVAIALPVLWALARVVGADRYRRYVMPVMGAALVAVGLLWLVERLRM